MISDQKLAQAITSLGMIAPDVLDASLEVAAGKKRPLGDILLEKALIKPEQLGQLIAREYKVKFVDLRKEPIRDQVLRLLPELVAKKQQAVVFRQDAEGLKLAMADPANYSLIKMLEKKTGERVVPYYTKYQG